MKKITAILKESQFVDKLFGLREKQINTALTAAKNNIEEQSTQASIEYENLCKMLADKDVNYKHVLNRMIECKDIIYRSESTLEIIYEIEADLNSEVETTNIQKK